MKNKNKNKKYDMKSIPTKKLSIADIPEANINNWNEISVFSLTIPQEELVTESENGQSLINSDIDIREFSTQAIRKILYFTQRIINNQEGVPDSKTMTKIIEAINILRARFFLKNK